MMVYFMHFFKKFSVILIVVSISLLIIDRFSYSKENEILIKDVVINDKENLKYINFNQEISLGHLITKAINKGIPLVFKVTVKIVEIKDIWLTKTVLKKVGYYQIEYKALRKVYKIKDVNGNKYEYRFIDEAIQKISKVEDLEFSFINKNKNKNYELWLNVNLERKKLPKPLQVNYFDRTWNVKSNKSINKL
ncbi:MAG: hypothetical protein ACI8WO_000308 [Methylophilaceae bacterium]|jgi:hypothetical protein